MKLQFPVFLLFFLLMQLTNAQDFVSDNDDLTAIDYELYYEALHDELQKNEIEIDQDDQSALNTKKIKMQAIKDAQNNYQGKNSGAVWTGVAAALTSPVLGFIPAAITTSAAPSNKNLRINNEKLQNDYDYYTTYRKEAKKIKKKRNWAAYGIGSAVWFFILLVTY